MTSDTEYNVCDVMKADIPPKVILGIADILSDPLTKMFNNAKKI